MKNAIKQLNNGALKTAILMGFFGVLLFPSVSLADSPQVVTYAASNITSTSALLNASVTSTEAKGIAPVIMSFEYGTNSSLGGGSITSRKMYWPVTNLTVSKRLFGLKTNTTYYFRAVARDTGGTTYGQTLSFNTGGGSNSTVTNTTTTTDTHTDVTTYRPIVNTTYPTSIYENSATINGFIDPNSAQNITHWFEWGTDQHLSNAIGYTSAGLSPHSFSLNLTGLQSGTTYYYRAVANSSGGTVPGSMFSFKTLMPGEKPATGERVVPPVVIIQQTTLINTHGARVAATAIQGSTPLTQGYFEYGTTASFGNTTPLQNIAQTGTANLSATLSGLESGTKYYVRVIVKDIYNTSYQSGTGSFTTLSGAATAPATEETPTSETPAVTETKPATEAKPSVEQTNEAASVFFAPTAGALIGWFLAIIFFITSLVMGMMLVRRNHKNGNKGTGEVKNGEYQEFPIHPLNNTANSKT